MQKRGKVKIRTEEETNAADGRKDNRENKRQTWQSVPRFWSSPHRQKWRDVALDCYWVHLSVCLLSLHLSVICICLSVSYFHSFIYLCVMQGWWLYLSVCDGLCLSDWLCVHPCSVSHLFFCIFCRLSQMHRWTDIYVRLNSTAAAPEHKKCRENRHRHRRSQAEWDAGSPWSLAATLEGTQQHTASQWKKHRDTPPSGHPTVRGLDTSQSGASHINQIPSVRSQHALARQRVIAVTTSKTEKSQNERPRGWISAMSLL